MCKCTTGIKTPFCGKPGCEWPPQHDSDCSTNNRGVHELLGPCDCSLSQAKPTCTDERPCVNCFSGQGECEVGPFGGPELLEQARALCQAIERLPAGEHQTMLISKVSDAAFALQNLQSTGDYFWPRPIAPEMTNAAKDVLSERPNVDWERYDLLKAHINRIVYDKTKNTLKDWISDYGGSETEQGRIEFGSHYALAKMLDRRDKEVIRYALGLLFTEQPAQAIATPEADDLTQFLEQTDFDAAEKLASEKADAQPLPTSGEDDCEGCKI